MNRFIGNPGLVPEPEPNWRSMYYDLKEENKKLKKEIEIRRGKLIEHYLYGSWQAMKNRCYNKNNVDYHYYGGRGITVCERWIDSFVDFAIDVGDRPIGMTLDRIDNDGNYEPNNVKWSTQSEQTLNSRKCKK